MAMSALLQRQALIFDIFGNELSVAECILKAGDGNTTIGAQSV
jgi:hypothetical protein